MRPLLYALTYPELFDKARPLRLFAFGEIRCVFAGYYFPQRFESWLCDDQSAFVQEVYDFKDGKDDCTEYFFLGIPDSFHRQGCYGYVHAMQHFLPLLQTFFRHCRFLKLMVMPGQDWT